MKPTLRWAVLHDGEFYSLHESPGDAEGMVRLIQTTVRGLTLSVARVVVTLAPKTKFVATGQFTKITDQQAPYEIVGAWTPKPPKRKARK